jgi:hypothetical protein
MPDLVSRGTGFSTVAGRLHGPDNWTSYPGGGIDATGNAPAYDAEAAILHNPGTGLLLHDLRGQHEHDPGWRCWNSISRSAGAVAMVSCAG